MEATHSPHTQLEDDTKQGTHVYWKSAGEYLLCAFVAGRLDLQKSSGGPSPKSLINVCPAWGQEVNADIAELSPVTRWCTIGQVSGQDCSQPDEVDFLDAAGRSGVL